MIRLIVFLLCSAWFNATALTIYALGTSNTNCKGADQAYTRKLSELLDGQARVINGGVNGDRPVWMLNRIKTVLEQNPDIRMVIFEPGPNEANRDWNLPYAKEILQYLYQKNIVVIYVSHNGIQTPAEAEFFAISHGAYYYGPWTRGVPTDRDHRQYDRWPHPGHMTVRGCELWAERMAPMIRQAIKENNLAR